MFFPFFFPFNFLFLVFFFVFGLRIIRFILRAVSRDLHPGPDRSNGIERWRRADAVGPWTGNVLRNREARIFQLAFRNRGRITVSDVVIETGMDPKQTEELLNGMVDGTRVRMEVSERGFVYYEFPELIARFEEE